MSKKTTSAFDADTPSHLSQAFLNTTGTHIDAAGMLVGGAETTPNPPTLTADSTVFGAFSTTGSASSGGGSLPLGVQDTATATNWFPNYPLMPNETTWWNNGLSWTYANDYRFWGVQQQTEILKGGPTFFVVNPYTLASLPRTARIVAWTLSENDAFMIAKLLNCDNGLPCAAPQLPKAEGAAVYTVIQAEVKALAGRILTVLDATISYAEQNKALKSLTKREFRDSLSKLWRHCHRSPGEGDQAANEPDLLD